MQESTQKTSTHKVRMLCHVYGKNDEIVNEWQKANSNNGHAELPVITGKTARSQEFVSVSEERLQLCAQWQLVDI